MRGLLFLFSIFLVISCASTSNDDSKASFKENPAAAGFDTVNSDVIAIALADSVMKAQGGRNAWDDSRFFVWNFFGSRKHWWDKQTGDIRIESFRTDLKIIMNINTMKGRVYIDSAEQTNLDTLKKYLEVGKEMWINDSYWLFMPFKLKDSGVTLKYIGAEAMQSGINAEVLQLTFKSVGVTPQNKYKVYINPTNYLVEQWAYYESAEKDSADIITPWIGYKQYGKLKLASSRGERDGKARDITEISVSDSLATQLFKEF